MRLVMTDGTGKEIVCDHWPSRVKPCLSIVKDNIETKVATFNNNESAKAFMRFLAEFVGACADAATERALAPEEVIDD